MLFITVQTSHVAIVPKVLQVVEQTKRLRHKAGVYILYHTCLNKSYEMIRRA